MSSSTHVPAWGFPPAWLVDSARDVKVKKEGGWKEGREAGYLPCSLSRKDFILFKKKKQVEQ